MTEKEVFEKVTALIKPYVKNAEALKNLTNETKILEDLEVNSARLVDIVLSFEDEFDIEVDDDAADNIWTIGDAVKLISSQIN